MEILGEGHSLITNAKAELTGLNNGVLPACGNQDSQRYKLNDAGIQEMDTWDEPLYAQLCGNDTRS